MLTARTKRFTLQCITFAASVALLVFPGHSAAQSTYQAMNFTPPGALDYTYEGVGWSFVPTSDLLVTAVNSTAPQVMFWQGTNQAIATYDYTGPYGSEEGAPTNFQAIPFLPLSAGQLYSISTQYSNFTSLIFLYAFANNGYGGSPPYITPFTNSSYISQFASYYISPSGEWTSTTTPPSENVNALALGPNFQFQLAPISPPELRILPRGIDVILTWPTNAVSFTLQSTTNLISPAVWSTVSAEAIVIGGQNVVTNAISGSQQFYRLIH